MSHLHRCPYTLLITKNATIYYYRIRGEYLPVSKLQLYSRNVAHWLHLYGLKCPQDSWSIRDWSRELTRNGSRNRIWRSSIIACITVASSSEDGPGTIRNFETIPLFGKRQENTGLLLEWRLRCRLSRTYERSKVKKSEVTRVAFSRSCASRGKHQKRSESDRSFLRVESSRGKNCTRRASIEHFWRVLPYRGLVIGVTTEPEFTLRVPIYSRRWHETVKKTIDTTRRGTGRQRDSWNGGTIRRLVRKKFDPPSIDWEFFFFTTTRQLICETCASRRRLASTRDACTTLHRTYLRSYVRS